MNSEEREIDLRDLIYRVFLGWRLILVCMLAGILLGGAFGYSRASKEISGTIPDEDEAKAQEESLKESLTENQMENIRLARAQVKEYQELIEKKQAYCEESILMREDPSAVPTVRLQYSIDNHYEVVYPTIEKNNNMEQIKQAYQAAVASEDVYQAAAEALGTGDAVEYVAEVISTEGVENGFSIRLTYLTEEGVRAMAEAVKQAVSDSYEKIQATCGDFDIVLNAESYSLDVNQDLMTTQNNVISQLTTFYNNKKNLTSSFSDDEQDYYDWLVEEEQIAEGAEETEAETGESGEASAEAAESAPSMKTVVKYLLLGALAGFFLACCFLGVRYILNGRVSTTADFEAYGLQNLSVIPVSGGKRRSLSGVDRFMERLALGTRRKMTAEKALALAVSYIEVQLKQKGQNQVMITGSDWSPEECALAARLQATLADAGFEARLRCGLLSDEDAIREAAAIGNVVLLEKFGRTRFEELGREKELLSVNQLTVLGVVMAEPRIAL